MPYANLVAYFDPVNEITFTTITHGSKLPDHMVLITIELDVHWNCTFILYTANDIVVLLQHLGKKLMC